MRQRLRFSLRTFLLAVAIVAMGLFWICWPTMTALSFVADPAVRPNEIIVDFDKLDEQMDRIRDFAADERNSTVKLVAIDRTLMDMLVGVQHHNNYLNYYQKYSAILIRW